jgi:hypothetical protein
MKKMLCTSVALLLAAGAVYAKGYELQKKAGDYTFEIRIDKNPPVMGNNVMDVLIKDAAGKAVTDAAVSVAYSMPPMQGMAPMNSRARPTAARSTSPCPAPGTSRCGRCGPGRPLRSSSTWT